MTVICFEGASAVGKTTTARALADTRGAFVVPEVNQLFTRPANESPEWYFERQVERWQIAQKKSGSHNLVIFDGDPFQPLWYNWAYDYVLWQKLDFMERFYRTAMQNKTIAFPELYFIFSTDEQELRKRRAGDAMRQRRHFETHLKMIEPQRRYFQAMHERSPARVLFLEADSVESNIEFVCRNIEELETHNLKMPDFAETERLLNEMTKWHKENKA